MITAGWLLNNGLKSKHNEEAVPCFTVQSLHLPEEMKNHKTLHQNNQFSGHGLKQKPPEYEGVLIIQWCYYNTSGYSKILCHCSHPTSVWDQALFKCNQKCLCSCYICVSKLLTQCYRPLTKKHFNISTEVLL